MKIKNRILSIILSMGMLLPSVTIPVKAKNESTENFEKYTSISEVKGSGKFISTDNSAIINLAKEDDGNQYLNATGDGKQLTTNALLPKGYSRISMRVRFTGSGHVFVLRVGKDEKLYLMNVQAAGIRLLNKNDANTNVTFHEGHWYELTLLANTETKKLTLTLKDTVTGEEKSQEQIYSGAAALEIVEDAHLRVKLSGTNGVDMDDVVCDVSATAELEQTGRVLSVLPELTFKTDCEIPLEADNILLDGNSGYIGEVIDEGDGVYRAVVTTPLEKNKVYPVTLSGYVNSEGLETQLGEASFSTRDSGLTMTMQNGRCVVKNELSNTETAVVAWDFVNESNIREWDFEKLSLGANETFTVPSADNVMLMNNLTQRIPYDIYSAADGEYERAENGGLLEVEYDEKTFMLKGAGISPKGAYRPIIAAIVSESGENINFDTASKEDVLKNITYLCGFVTDSDGAYSFSTKTTFNTDRYKVCVSGIADNERTSSASMFMINPKDAEKLCKAINDSADINDIETALTTYSYVLDVDFALLNNMQDKSFVYTYLLDRKREKPYTLASSVSFDMKAAAVLDAINKADDEGARQLIDDYAAELGFATLEMYSLWTTLDNANKTAVVSKIHDTDYTSGEQFLNKLQRYTAYMVIKITERYSQVQDIIDNNAVLFGISLDKYNSIGAQSYVAKKMINKEYTDATFASAFNGFVSEFERQNKNQSSGGTDGRDSISSAVIESQDPKASLKPVTPQDTVKELNDLDTVPWAKESIIALFEKGIISGYSDGSFKPNQQITREEFVKLLVSCFGLVDNNASCDFKDVPHDAWFRPYVASAKEKGIVDGISDELFGTGTNLTRQDMCVMVYRTIKLLGIELNEGEPIEFSDADSISDYAAEAVNVLSAAGVISGIDDKFAPKEFCTRAQVAKVLYEIYSITNTDDDTSDSGEVVETSVSDIERDLVNALGMLDFEEDTIITRGEFAGELVKLMGMESAAGSVGDVQIYSDVDKFTENGGAIEFLSKSSIMAGYDDNTFGPDDAINSHIAVATVCRALGYAGDISDSDKIYETAIMRGLPAMEDKELTYSEAVHLFYEALYCEVRQKDSTETEIVLESIFDTYEGVGIVTATEVTSLDGNTPAPRGQIRIDNQTYISDGFSQYLGYRVKYYYRDEKSNDKTIVYTYPKGTKILDIAAENIDDFQSRRLSYSVEGKKTKNIKIPLSADIIYNGKAYPDYSDAIFKPKAGNVRLIDAGNGYNTVIINEYTSGVLTKISQQADKLYFEGGDVLSIDNIDYLYIENSEAKALNVNELKVGTVVSYMQSKDNTVLKLITSDAVIEGTIQTFRADIKEVVIEDNKYILSPDFQPNMDVLKAGATMYMYLDYRGLIVMAKTGENNSVKLGYLIRAYLDEAGDTWIHMLTADNELKHMQCKNKLRINDKSVSNNMIESELCGNSSSEAQLIRYRLDETGKLSWIETAVNRDNYTELVSDTENTEKLYIDVKLDSNVMFKTGINTFAGICMVDDSTSVFCVKADTSTVDKQNFYSGNIGMLDGDQEYKFISYRTGSLGTSADAVVIFLDDIEYKMTSSIPISVLTNIYDGVNDDGEIVQYASLIKQNKELTYEIDENVKITDAQDKSAYTENGESIPYTPGKGDTIRFLTNREGKISKIQILFDCSRSVITTKTNPNDNNYGGSQFHCIFAKVYDYSEQVLTLCKNTDMSLMKKSDIEMYRQIESVPITVCEIIQGKLTTRTGTVDDIKSYRQVKDDCSYIFLSCRYGAPQSIIIYDNAVIN